MAHRGAWKGPKAKDPGVEDLVNFMHDMRTTQHIQERAAEFSQSATMAMLQGKLATAEQLFKNAHDMLRKLPPDEIDEEMADLLENRSELYQKLGKYDLALDDAKQLIELRRDRFDGYWQAGKTARLMGQFGEALQFLYQGLICLDGLEWDDDYDLRIFTLAEISIIMLRVEEVDENLIEYILDTGTPGIWQRVVAQLSIRNEWEAVNMLVLGTTGESTELGCVAKTCPAESINIAGLLKNLGNQALEKWGQKLAVTFLKSGASLASIKQNFDDQPLHIALELSLRTGSFELLRYILEKLGTDTTTKNIADKNGDTALHIVVKSGKSNTTVGETAIRLLLNNQCSVTIKDHQGRLPIDYLTPADQVYNLLTKAIQGTEEEVKRLQQQKERGNLAMKQHRFHDALREYSDAIRLSKSRTDLSRNTAVLYSNRSAVNSKLNKLEAALQDAEDCIACDPTWPKGYWRKGHILKQQNRFPNAFMTLHDGYRYGQSEEDALVCLVDAVNVLPKIKDCQSFLDMLRSVENSVLTIVLERLAKANDWWAVKLLVLGTPRDVQKRWKKGSVSGIASGASAKRIQLSNLVGLIDAQPASAEWAWKLLNSLLTLGAPYSSLCANSDDTEYHAALRLGLSMGDTSILDKMLNAQDGAEAKEITNNKGELLFHTLTKSPKASQLIGQQFAQLLTKHGVHAWGKDPLDKTPIDYLSSRGKTYEIILQSSSSRQKKPENKPAQMQTSDDKAVVELKEKGNALYQKRDYYGAMDYYSRAISRSEASQQCRPSEHEMAVLYSNRANAFLKLDKGSLALEDAKKSVSYDAQWFKGHFRVAKSFQVLRKYHESATAYINALDCCGDRDSDNAVELLADLVYVCNQLEMSSLFKDLPVAAHVWARVALKLVVDDHWGMASQAFDTFVDRQPALLMPTRPNLQVLCQLKQLAMYSWANNLIAYFLECGADKHTLSITEGDTYFLASVAITMVTGKKDLLTYVVDQILCEEVKNKPDREGNTALHYAVKKNKHLDYTFQATVIDTLCEIGVNPLITNKRGLMPIEVLQRREKLCRQVLQTHMDNVMYHDGSTRSVFCSSKSYYSSTDANKGKYPKGKASPVYKPTTPSKPTPAPKSVPRRAQWDPCDNCDTNLKNAKEYHRKGLAEQALECLCKMVNIRKHTGDRHKRLYMEGINEMVSILGETPRPDVPNCMIRLSEQVYKALIGQLAGLDKWRQVDTLLEAWKREKNDGDSLALSLSITDVIRSDSLQGDPNYRRQVISALLSNGAKLCAGREARDEPITVALERKDYRLVLLLLEQGASPSHIKLEPGDTPIHTALQIALELEKGFFGLFEALLKKFDDDPASYSYLNPSQQDKGGNSLYHLAAKCKYSKHAQKAIEMLCERRIDGSLEDNSGHTPLDYVTKQIDRRRQYLRMAAALGVPKAPPERKKEAKSSGSKSVHGKKGIGKMYKLVPETKDEELSRWDEIPDEEASSLAADVSGTLPKGKKQACKNNIRVFISELADYADREQAEVEEDLIQFNEIADETRLDDIDSDLEGSRPGSPCTSPVIEGSLAITEAIEKGLLVMEDDDVGLDGNLLEQVEEIDAKIFDNLEWEVECTAEVWKILKDKHVPFILKERAILKIQRLASGEWTDSLTKPVHNVPKTLELYEAKVSKGGRILWELAIAFSPRCSDTPERILGLEFKGEYPVDGGGRIYTQVIRVWDIVLQHDKLYHHIQRIVKSHGRGEECILQKKLQSISPNSEVRQEIYGDNKVKRIPLLFVETEENGPESDVTNPSSTTTDIQPFFPPASSSDTEYHIMKFYSFSSALVSYILQNIEMKVDFPFRVTDLEHAVISLQSRAPILLLGRSGTGKTTCCLYRLWNFFLKYWIKANEAGAPLLPRSRRFIEIPQLQDEEEDGSSGDDEEEDSGDAISDDENFDVCTSTDVNIPELEGEEPVVAIDHLHQIFITKNAVLCSEVMKNFRELSHACDDVVHTHVDQENRPLQNRLQDVDDLQYPLFLTSRQLLLMLDASLPGTPFFQREDDGRLKKDIKGWTDMDSPLAFIPCTESDSDFEDDAEEGVLANGNDAISRGSRGEGLRQLDPRREVTYEVFSEELWAKIRKKQQKLNYHPTLIWMEINSFIKGSLEALNKPRGHLNKDEYMELGRKRAPNFTGERDLIYQMFERYEQVKRQQGLFDECDLVLDIYRRLREVEVPEWAVHQIFVDETQDFTQAELCLLIRLCQNPNDMFLTGDTAQGIMRGISFRFSDLKSLFFHARRSLHVMGKAAAIEVPKRVYQLTHNYRSHAGILSLATSVVDLMVEFFPESFDRLQKDQGLFHGPQPVLLESCSFSDLALLLRGNRRRTSEIEFGAHQAILVVNDAARETIPEELRLGLVLTIYEAKGLEFDDVLLYNFFKDSQGRKEWRVVTDYLQRLSDSGSKSSSHPETHSMVELDMETLRASSTRPLTFDADQHKVLNSELKHMYTAVTRARVNLWIFDEDEENRAPMFDYFKSRRLVRTITADETKSAGISDAMFAERSSSSDWSKRGDDFMKHHLYEVASKCYQRAGNDEKENQALAHASALRAGRLREIPRKMREEFLYAAEQYLHCNMNREAARCLQNARERELAAKLYEKMGELERAGYLYQRCKLTQEASRCYEQLGLFNRSVTTLCDDEQYDLAVDVLRRYKMLVKDYKGRELPARLRENQPSPMLTIERLSHKAAGLHNQHKNFNKMLAALERLPNVDDRIRFLLEKKHPTLAAEMLKDMGRFHEASTTLLAEGEYTEALGCAKSAVDNSLIGQCLLVSCQHQLVPQWWKSDDEKRMTEAVQKLSEDDRNRHCEQLDLAVKHFQITKDFSGMGESKLLLGYLRQDLAQVKNAYKDFNSSRPTANEAGMVEYCKVEMSLGWLAGNADSCYFFGGRGLEKLFKVLAISQHPLTTEEKEKANVYERYYGLEVEDEDSVKFHPRHYPRCLRFLKDPERSFDLKSQVTIKVSRALVRESLAAYLLDTAKDWITYVSAESECILKQNTPCLKYASGFQCTDSQLPCPHLHEPFTKKTYHTALKCLLALVHIEANVHKAYSHRSLRSSALQQRLKDLCNLDKFACSRRLVHFLFPSRSHLKVVTENVALTQKFLYTLRSSEIRQQLQEYLQECWMRADDKERICTTGLYVEGILLYRLFGSSPKHFKIVKDGWMNKAQRKFKEEFKGEENPAKVPHSKAMMVEEEKKLNQRRPECHYFCYALRFYDAIDWLYRVSPDPLESLIKFGKFITLLGNKGRPGMFPDYGIFLFWMEFYVVVAFCLGAKHDKHYLILPSSYLAIINFLDGVFADTKSKILPLFQAIQGYKPSGNWKRMLSGRIEKINDLVCGNVKTNLIQEYFSASLKDIKSGVAERGLVLYLTLLSNVGGVVPIICEKSLLQVLYDIDMTTTDQWPLRLRMAVEKTMQAKGQRSIARTLRDLLGARNNEKLYKCTWTWEGGVGKEKGLCHEILTNFDPLPQAFYTIDESWTEASEVADEEDLKREDAYHPDVDEVGLTEEELRLHLEEERKREHEAARTRAVATITRFLHRIRLRRRAQKLYWYVQVELAMEKRSFSLPEAIEEEVFRTCAVDDSMCGICGVAFSREATSSEAYEGYYDRSADSEGMASPGKDAYRSLVMDDASGDCLEGTTQEKPPTRAEHLVCLDHKLYNFQYISFRSLVADQLWPLVEKVSQFMENHGIVDSFNSFSVKDLTLDIKRLSDTKNYLWRQLKEAANNRNWGDTGPLKDKMDELRIMFDHLKPMIERCLDEAQKPTVGASSAGPSQSRSGVTLSGLSDNEDLGDDLEVVVPEPDVSQVKGRRARKKRAKQSRRS